VRIILGAGGTRQEGWISTEQDQLDLLKLDDFERLIGDEPVEAMLAEHIFEHLTLGDAIQAFKNCYKYLSAGGYLRIAVPDGFHPDLEYLRYVSPPNTGHKFLYDYYILSHLLEQAGFTVNLLEWWDEFHIFNGRVWNEIDGNIERCLANDLRNQDGKPHYTSLIVDAVKKERTE
jgi:predicted SAM-dependent methyltransferase